MINPDTLPPGTLPPAHSNFYSLRRILRQTPTRLLLALVVMLGGITWYIVSVGGWINFLHQPPVLDASTPRCQNGWTLLDVQMPAPHKTEVGQGFTGFQYEDVSLKRGYDPNVPDTADAFGLWLTPPPGSVVDAGPYHSPTLTFEKNLTVTARLSTGDTLPLGWQLCSQDWLPRGEATKHLVAVTPADRLFERLPICRHHRL